MTEDASRKDKPRRHSAKSTEKQTPTIVEIVFGAENGGSEPASEADVPKPGRRTTKKKGKTSITFDFTNNPG